MNDISQWYGVLGVSPTASPKTIKEAYRELAQLWHPDRYVDDPELKARAESEIKEINQAYSEIKAHLSAKVNAPDTVVASKTKVHSIINKVQSTPESYYQQGVNFAEEQRYEDALTSFAQAIKLNPNYLEAYQYRGFILGKMGFNLRADAEFKKAHQIKLKNRFKQPQKYTIYNEQHSDNATEVPLKAETSLWLKCRQTILSNDKPCNSLIITQSGEIAGSNNSPEIQLWQARIGQPIGSLQGHSDRVTCLALSPSGQTLISGSKDQTIKFWDLRNKKLMRTFTGEFDGHLNEITTVAISPDNQILLSCDLDNSLKVWSVNHARVIKNISFSADVTCLAINPNGQLFCSGGLESQIRIRQIKDGQVIRSINNQSGVLSIAFSPDGKLLATSGFNRTIKLWDLVTGKEICTFTGHLDRISKVIFSPDGQTLISSSWDNTIRLWSLNTAQEIACIQAHANPIKTMAIAPNGQTLISSSSDRQIKLWQSNF
ncbi:MAG: DnaJ domain-containing protein [Cyanobacteria bacterium P01_A01_bin.83]